MRATEREDRSTDERAHPTTAPAINPAHIPKCCSHAHFGPPRKAPVRRWPILTSAPVMYVTPIVTSPSRWNTELTAPIAKAIAEIAPGVTSRLLITEPMDSSPATTASTVTLRARTE